MKHPSLFALSLSLLALSHGDMDAAIWKGNVGNWNDSSQWNGGNWDVDARITAGIANVTTAEQFILLHINSGASVNIDGGSLNSPGSSVDHQVAVGTNSQGSFSVTNGGGLTTGYLVLGYAPAGNGSGTVSGAGSAVEAKVQMLVGAGGEGYFLVEDHGLLNITATHLIIGANESGQGRLDVTSEGRVEGQGDLWVGYHGSGELHITDGGVVDFENAMCVGSLVDEAMPRTGNGTLVIDGDGSKLEAREASVGQGSITIQNQGKLSVEEGIWVDGATQSTLTVGSGGIAEATALVIGSSYSFGRAGAEAHVLIQNGGSVSVTEEVWVGYGEIVSSLLVEGSDSLLSFDLLRVQTAFASVEVRDGGRLFGNQIDLAAGSELTVSLTAAADEMGILDVGTISGASGGTASVNIESDPSFHGAIQLTRDGSASGDAVVLDGGLELNISGIAITIQHGNTYDQGTNLTNQAILYVQNSGETSATGSGLVSVDASSQLSGSGRIGGSVAMRGRINSIDGAVLGSPTTLTIDGDLDLYSGSYLYTVAGDDIIYNVTVGGTATIHEGAKLGLVTPASLTANSYTILDAYDGITDNTLNGFVFNGTIPNGFELVYSEHRVELVRLPAQFGTVTATPENAAVVIGGSTSVVVTVGNNAPADYASLEGSAAGGGGNTTGSGTVSVAPGATGTVTNDPDDPITFTGDQVGIQTGSVTVTDPDATGNPGGDTFTVTVYGHAVAEIADTTFDLGFIREGYSAPITSTGIDVTNGDIDDLIVDLKGDGATSGNASINSFDGLAAGDSTQLIATLATGQTVGVFTETLSYTFGDDSSLNGALDDIGSQDFIVTGHVYNGQGVWNKQGGGSWGTHALGFGANWQDGGGSPGLDAGYETTDTATFGASGSGVVSLDGAAPSLRGITFDNANDEYQLRTGTGGSIALNAGSDTATIINQSGSHLIAVPLELVSNTRVEVVQANDRLTIQGLLSGSGDLTIAGSGRTLINSHQSHTGDTIVESGSLASRSLGNSRLVLNGGVYSPNDLNAVATVDVAALELNGGTLEFDLGDQVSDQIIASDEVILTAATHFNFNNVGFTPGVYQLITAGAGQMLGFDDINLLSFSSSNITNLQGLFGVDAGTDTLYFRAWQTDEVITGGVLSNEAPYLIPDVATFGVVGSVVTIPSESIVTINALQFSPSASLMGSNQVVVTSGSLEWSDGPALISGLTISSPSSIKLSGSGVMEIDSSASLSTLQSISLSPGSVLVLNGSASAGLGLYSGPSAVLFGSGTLNGDFINAGSLRPGNSPGTFRVTGNYTQTSSGSLQIEVASYDHDRLIVGGTARLDGTLDVRSYGGHQFAYGDEVTFLYALKIQGDFARIISPDASRFRVRFLKDDGEGSLLFAPTSYTLVANTPNERSTAKALDRFIDAKSGDRYTVSLALDHLTADEYAHAFQQVSPAFYSSMSRLVLSQANTQNQTLAQRLDQQRQANAVRGFRSGTVEAPVTIDRNGKNVVTSDKNPTLLEATPDNRWSVWVEGNGAFTKVPNALQIGDKQYRGGGFLVGSDYQWSEFLTTGVFGGYQGVRADYGGGNKIGLDSAIFGAYGAWQAGGFHGNVILSGGQHQFDVRRSIRFGSIDRQANSDPQGRQFNAYLDFGRDVNFGAFTFSPILAGQYSYANLSSFSEDGANSLNLNVKRQEAHSLRSDLGARFAYTAVVNSDLLIIPEVRATWNHEFLDSDRTLSSNFSGAPGQTMNYYTSGDQRDSVNLAAGVSAHINQSWNASLFYNANLGRGNDTNHSVTGSIGWKF